VDREVNRRETRRSEAQTVVCYLQMTVTLWNRK